MTNETYSNELRSKEISLQKREKELLKIYKHLKRKEKKIKKRLHSKATLDLKAASILRKERKKLIYTLDASGKNKKSRSRKSTNKNGHKRSYNQHITKYKRKMNKPSNERKKVSGSYITRILGSCNGKTLKNIKKYLQKFDLLDSTTHTSNSRRKGYWEGAAGDCYLMSLKRTPQLWVYHRWPHFYPEYLNARAHWRNFGQIMLFISGILFWTPCFLCLELCKCCFCACCYDN